jgi:hypothetical protein
MSHVRWIVALARAAGSSMSASTSGSSTLSKASR